MDKQTKHWQWLSCCQNIFFLPSFLLSLLFSSPFSELHLWQNIINILQNFGRKSLFLTDLENRANIADKVWAEKWRCVLWTLNKRIKRPPVTLQVNVMWISGGAKILILFYDNLSQPDSRTRWFLYRLSFHTSRRSI